MVPRNENSRHSLSFRQSRNLGLNIILVSLSFPLRIFVCSFLSCDKAQNKLYFPFFLSHMTPENESIFSDFCSRNVLRGLIVHLDLVPTPPQPLYAGEQMSLMSGLDHTHWQGEKGESGRRGKRWGAWMVSYNWSRLAWVISHTSTHAAACSQCKRWSPPHYTFSWQQLQWHLNIPKSRFPHRWTQWLTKKKWNITLFLLYL